MLGGGGGGGGSVLSKLKSLFLHKREPIAILPDELYLEIFLRLPVKSTFTCKCVSKTWFSIISSPDFVKLHLNYTLKINNNHRFVLSGFNMMIQESQIYTITRHSLFSTSEFRDKAVVMEHHPYKSEVFIGIAGSCNGLVCLWHHTFEFRYGISLWNPATGEYKNIPDLPYEVKDGHPKFVFCYDYKNDDYKLVCVQRDQGTPSFPVFMYSFRSNSWNCFQTKPRYAKLYEEYRMFGNEANMVLVNGAIHWISITPNVIVSFNISDGSFKEIQMPGEIKSWGKYCYSSLRVMEGCLCVINVEGYQVWVMHSYGVWGSWRKHQNKLADALLEVKWSSENDDSQIYSEGSNLVLYGPKGSSARRLKLHCLEIFSVDNYVESLVSLNSGTYLGRKKVLGTRKRGIWRK